jgi:uncharacterized protein (TIRG00374 family)
VSELIGRVRHRWLKVALRFGATAVILVVLFSVVAWDDVWSALASAAWPWLVLMYAVALIRQLIDAAQLRYLLRNVDVELPVRRVFLASQLASFYSLVVPGDIASSVAKWANLSVATGKRSTVLSAMIYNKLLMLSVPALIGTVALIVEDPFDRAWVVALAASILLAIVVALVALYHPRFGSWTEGTAGRIARRFPESIERRVGYLTGSMQGIRRLPPRHHVIMVSFVTVSVGSGVLRVWLGIQALGLGVSVFSVLWIMAFALIGRILPITVASLGIRESLLVVALTPLGVERGAAVALGLLGFSTIVMLAVIGAAYQISLVAGWASSAGTPDVADSS